MRKLALLLCPLFMVLQMQAAHLFGGEIFYQYVSGNTYKVTLKLYADCGSKSSGAYPSLTNGNPLINILKNGVLLDSFRLAQVNSSVEISPVCAASINNTACNGGTLPGVEAYTYSGNTTLNSTSANWEFQFAGSISLTPTSSSIAGRSANISNVVNAGNTVMQLSAQLNNTSNINNSSPNLSAIATPYFCNGQAQTYNPGAIDANGDSLHYDLIDAYDANVVGGALVTYSAGFTAQTPINTFTNTFFFNGVNGQLSFKPAGVQNSLVLYKISEYKNGVFVGSVMRELAFIVLANCSNLPPSNSAGITNNNTGVVVNNNTINVCKGAGTLSFKLPATDPEGNNITLSAIGLPSGSSASFAGNGTPNATLNFTWNIANTAPGTYNIIVTYKDDGCPLSFSQTVAYTINIFNPPTVSATNTSFQYCKKLQPYTFNIITNEAGPFFVIVKNAQNIIIDSFKTSALSWQDSLPSGNNTITVGVNGTTCIGITNVNVPKFDSLPQPITATSLNYCIGSTANTLAASGVNGAAVNWITPSNNVTVIPPVPNITSAGTQIYKVYQTINTCISDTVSVSVNTYAKPTSTFTAPTKLCAGDTFKITYTGTSSPSDVFTWNWDNISVIQNLGNETYALVNNNASVSNVTLVVKNPGCTSNISSAFIDFDVEPASNFTYTNICLGDTLVLQKVGSTQVPGVIYTWNIANASYTNLTFSNNAVQASWSTAGTYLVTLKSDLGDCGSTTTKTVVVFPTPTLTSSLSKQSFCQGDTVIINMAGGADYKLLSPKIYNYNNADKLFVYPVVTKDQFVIKGTSLDGCLGTTTLSVDSIKDCCWFSFPDAFTPNKDSKNDKFKAITIGNFIFYNLRVYNRWGNVVFSSNSPDEAWDGTYKKEPLTTDLYFYMLNAKCFNGRSVLEKGEVLLSR